MPPVISIVGRSGSGKTTVLEALIAELIRRGARVGVLKHSRGFEVDHEGKDTWRLRRAGAQAVGIVSPDQVAIIRKPETEMLLDDAVALLGSDLDVVLTEGFKQAPTPKIEVIRAETGCEVLTRVAQLLAVISDCPVETTARRLAFGDVAELADIVIGQVGSR